MEFFARRSNLLAKGTESRLKRVTSAEPKARGKPDHKRSSQTTSVDLLPEIRTTERAQSMDSQRSPHIFPLIPGKLNLAFHPNPEFSTDEIHRRRDLFFFSTDLHERYLPFCEDFGPVNIGIIYIFWQYVRSKEHHPDLRKRPLVYYTFMNTQHQINASFLLGTYMMLEHNMTAAQAATAIETIPNTLPGFRDATFCVKDFDITLRDCCMGLQRALEVGWFKAHTFDLAIYQELEDIGDMSLVGNKFVAFRGPQTKPGEKDKWVLPPKAYTTVFKNLGVTSIVRLNEPESYDKEDFEEEGFKVYDMEFEDCSCPSPAQIKKFLDVVEGATGKVAVHCKAGLGRTGTMIALWMMKNRGFSAREAIAWLRLCRPGCVIGPQQHFLVACESMVWEGNTLLPCTDSRSKQSLKKCSPLELTVTGRRKSLPPLNKLEQKFASTRATTSEELAKQVENGSRARSLAMQSKAAAPQCVSGNRRRISISGFNDKTAFEAPRKCIIAA